MPILERLRPDPVPAIHPMPEYMASDQRAEWYADTQKVLQVPFMLMEYHHADEPTRFVYEDIKATLQLPLVNTDYRAFARWPSYFALAWNDLRDKLGTSRHEEITRACHVRAAKLAAVELPNPGGLSSKALRQAAKADASLDEIIQVCRLFQWLIPGLITNVAYFRHQLEAV